VCLEFEYLTMAKKRSQDPPDDPQYVEQWAKALIAAIGKRQARTVLSDYRRLSRNPKGTTYDRAMAAQRVKTLAKYID